jgi:hypothetical protein
VQEERIAGKARSLGEWDASGQIAEGSVCRTAVQRTHQAPGTKHGPGINAGPGQGQSTRDCRMALVPPRYAFWTILIDQRPTAFRAKVQEDLLPTLHQLRRTNDDVVLRWFARGKLWESPEAERAAQRAPKFREKRGPEWRPGGQHSDPRARFDTRSNRGKGDRGTVAARRDHGPSSALARDRDQPWQGKDKTYLERPEVRPKLRLKPDPTTTATAKAATAAAAGTGPAGSSPKPHFTRPRHERPKDRQQSPWRKPDSSRALGPAQGPAGARQGAGPKSGQAGAWRPKSDRPQAGGPRPFHKGISGPRRDRRK